MITANPSTRSQLKEKRQQALPRRTEASLLLFERLRPLLVVPTLSFVSLPQEVDMTPVNRYLFARNLLLLPRIDGNKLALHRVDSWDLVANRYGILEPKAEAPPAEPAQILVPALAFDKEGNRIGYGGGYYDRLLADFSGASIGVCFKEQVVEGILPQPHDQPVSSLVEC